MAGDQFDRSDQGAEALHWTQAAAFMNAHGDRWLDEAALALKVIAVSNREALAYWTELVTKMTVLAQAPRQ